MSHAATISGLSPPADPPDRPTTPLPRNIAALFVILNVLAGYASHLAETLEPRAAAQGFASIAQFFGTARLPVIFARLLRGMLRIVALQNVLRARAARGHDLVLGRLRPRKPRTPRPPPPDTPAQPPAADAPAEPPPPRGRRADPDAPPDADNLPSVEQLEAEIRRHSIGWAIAAICRDLGSAPGLCERAFWNLLFEAITWNRGSVPQLFTDFRRRRAAFVPEWDRNRALGMPAPSGEGARRALGFLIGQPPVLPFQPPVLPFPPPVLPFPPPAIPDPPAAARPP